jgi:hypothetical protein
VAETPVDWIAFYFSFLGVLLQFERPYLQIVGSVGLVMPRPFCEMFLPPVCWSEYIGLLLDPFSC